jgi:type III restriction enzyme
MPEPQYDEVIKLKTFAPPRATDRTVSPDRFGTFSKSVAYNGWKRSLYAIEWFDSRPERDVANALDGSEQITCWIRLHTGELPILWTLVVGSTTRTSLSSRPTALTGSSR